MNPFIIKNRIYDTISTRMKSYFPKLNVSGTYSLQVSKFPILTVEEKDNAVYQRASTDSIQNGVLLMYELNVSTNSKGNREQDAREIMAKADEIMVDTFGFTRTMCSPVPNIADSTIFRLTARYEGVALSEGTDASPSFRVYQPHVSQGRMK